MTLQVPPDAPPARRLTSRSFVGFLICQFLGAVNDNTFRWLIVPIAKYKAGDRLDEVVLASGLACFTLPYILLAPYAGYLADRFSKRDVIIGCKIAEIVIMLLGVVAVWWGSTPLLMLLLALMGAQSALFSPAKFGVIPELVSHDRISNANGWVGMTTVLAAVVGTIIGNWLYGVTKPLGVEHIEWSAIVLLGTAIVGWVASLFIRPLPAASPTQAFPTNPVKDCYRDLKLLWDNKPLYRTSLGIAFFWSLAALAQLNVDSYTIHELHLNQQSVGIFLAILSLGVAIGSILAGLWSGGRVELGIVPLAAFALAVSSMILSFDFVADSKTWTAVLLFVLGAGGGLFNVPLNAFLQERSPHDKLGAILAAGNLLTFTGMLIVSGLFALLGGALGASPSTIFLLAGLGTIPVTIYVFTLLPNATIRLFVWLMAHTVYKVRIYGQERIPETGGALLVANHVSWLDGVLMILATPRPVRMIAYADYIDVPGVRWLSKLFEVIPIKGDGGPKAILRSLKTARQAIENGELVCIFAEGGITRTGQIQPFQQGMLRIIGGTETPVVPVYLDELWGSIFSFSGGRLFWKWPRRWPYPVTVLFGDPLPCPDAVEPVQRAVQELGVEAMELRKSRSMVPQRLFLRQCRRSLFRPKVADSSGKKLTGGKLLTGTLVLRRLLSKHVLAADEKRIGVLLPPSVGGVLVNAALSCMGRVAVNLNYTLTNEDVNFCIEKAGIRHVLTSRRFLEKRPFDMNAEVVCLEDLLEKVSGADKAISLVQAFTYPAAVLEKMLGLHKVQVDDLLTVIFTSGSTGRPKGVMLSHGNVASNIKAVDDLFHITKEDVLLGVLPFFHSFGYTGTLWLPLTLDAMGVYHFNPLDGREIGKLCGRHGVTIVMATPTFLRTYLKRCDTEQMSKLNLTIVGAEKLPLDLARAFEEKFGVLPVEGYGTTELSPVAAFNVPASRAGESSSTALKLGSVGRVMPGAAARIVHPETREDMPPNSDGLLLIKGPNVMLGYLDEPEQTAEVIQDGWYNTGDIAYIDDDGFIHITGRQSRFSKIGGEMVPHLKVEELLLSLLGDDDDEDTQVRLAVTSVPDPKKGERLVVVHKPLPKPVNQLLRELGEKGVPNLWLPGADSFLETEEIPLLGTGKLDLKGLKQLAMERFAPELTESGKSS